MGLTRDENSGEVHYETVELESSPSDQNANFAPSPVYSPQAAPGTGPNVVYMPQQGYAAYPMGNYPIAYASPYSPQDVHTINAVTRDPQGGNEDLMPSILIFVLGWLGICCIWMAAAAYIHSSNNTARIFAWLSLTMYCLVTFLIVLLCIWVFIVSVSPSSTYNNGYNNSTTSCQSPWGC